MPPALNQATFSSHIDMRGGGKQQPETSFNGRLKVDTLGARKTHWDIVVESGSQDNSLTS